MTDHEWLSRCGIGARYWDATRERLREPGPIVAYLDNLPDDVRDGRGLLLLGPVGTGKTAALALIAREAQDRLTGWTPVWYCTTSRLISHLLRGTEMMRFQDTTSGRGEPYEVDPKDATLLLLDEFGAAYESDYAMAAFEDYLGLRYDQRLATCVAANLTPEQIKAKPHYARMVDRWKETCRVVVIGGVSMRQIAKTMGGGTDG